MARIKERKRADGSTAFTVSWVLGGGSGGAGKREASETFNTRPKAESFREDVVNAGENWPRGWVKGHGYVTETAAKTAPIFAQVAASYFEHKERGVTRGRLQADTLSDYRSHYRNHLDEFFGSMAFADIDHDLIEEWIDHQVEAGYMPKGVSNQHGTLSGIMKHGQLRMKLRQDNPCEISELPKDNRWEKRQVRFLLREDWAAVRRCLSPDVHLLADILLSTGMRWGEVSALWVSDVQFAEDGAANIQIQRAWKRRVRTDPAEPKRNLFETNTTKLGMPKSKRSRWVVITGETADQLRDHIAGLPDDRLWLFMTPGRAGQGVPWRHEDFQKMRWRPAVAQAMKEYPALTKKPTVHMLRHTAVVWSVADGVPLEKISEMLGHASIQITWNIYGGLLDVKDRTMAMVMARRLLDISSQPALRAVG